MQITQRGYIVNNDTGMVSGTWLVSGGTFVGFPGEDAALKEVLDTLRRDGIPVLTERQTLEGKTEYLLSFNRSTNASLADVGETMATMGYSLFSAEEVEMGQTDEEWGIETEIIRDGLDAWYEKRGYILNQEGRPISVWYMIGDSVEVMPTGNPELDKLVGNLKVSGLSVIRRTAYKGDLAGHSKIIVPWVDAMPIEIATVLMDYGYAMVPAMEVESVTKEDHWNRGS